MVISYLYNLVMHVLLSNVRLLWGFTDQSTVLSHVEPVNLSTLFKGRLPKRLTSSKSPLTGYCPTWISGRERMAVEIVSWPNGYGRYVAGPRIEPATWIVSVWWHIRQTYRAWLTACEGGARWLSGRVSDSAARGRGLETYRRRVVSLSKTLDSPKVLVNYPGSDGSVPTWLKKWWLGLSLNTNKNCMWSFVMKNSDSSYINSVFKHKITVKQYLNLI